MKPLYERGNLIITEFDAEDVITTSGYTPVVPTEPTDPTDPAESRREVENAYGSYTFFNAPGPWF